MQCCEVDIVCLAGRMQLFATGSDTGTKASGPDIRRNPRRDCTDYRVFTTVRARKLKTVTIMPDPVLALV